MISTIKPSGDGRRESERVVALIDQTLAEYYEYRLTLLAQYGRLYLERKTDRGGGQ